MFHSSHTKPRDADLGRGPWSASLGQSLHITKGTTGNKSAPSCFGAWKLNYPPCPQNTSDALSSWKTSVPVLNKVDALHLFLEKRRQ